MKGQLSSPEGLPGTCACEQQPLAGRCVLQHQVAQRAKQSQQRDRQMEEGSTSLAVHVPCLCEVHGAPAIAMVLLQTATSALRVAKPWFGVCWPPAARVSVSLGSQPSAPAWPWSMGTSRAAQEGDEGLAVTGKGCSGSRSGPRCWS